MAVIASHDNMKIRNNNIKSKKNSRSIQGSSNKPACPEFLAKDHFIIE
jgi:hypothetical protein